MSFISQLLANGGIVVVILGLMVFEALILIPYYLRTGRGIAPRELLLTLSSGGSLVLAIGAVMLAAPLIWVGMALGLALVTHVLDIYLRWRTSAQVAVSEPVSPDVLQREQALRLAPAAMTVRGTFGEDRRDMRFSSFNSELSK